MKRPLPLIIGLALLIPPSADVFAQAPAADEFDPGANGIVNVLAVQPDGKILVAGEFTTLGGLTRHNLARLNADWTLDLSFTPEADGEVKCIAIEAGGTILVGGSFKKLNSEPCEGIGRLHSNGTMDTAFNPGVGGPSSNMPARSSPRPFVASLAVQADGKIVVGGYFTWLGGQPRNSIARLNPDGTVDGILKEGADGHVYALALQRDGKILVGGSFRRLAEQPCGGIARLNMDGTVDKTFSGGVGGMADWASGPVNALAIQSDGKILVGGGFRRIAQEERDRVGRLNANGTLDQDFKSIGKVNGPVTSLAVQPNGKVLVGGAFTSIGKYPRLRIARLNANGSLDESFDPKPGGRVECLVVQADGKILVGGKFNTVGTKPHRYVGRLNADGALDTTPQGVTGSTARGIVDNNFNPGADRTVASIVVQANGQILVGGGFARLAQQPRNGIGRLNADGTLDMDFNPGTRMDYRGSLVGGTVNTLVVQKDGKIVVAGYFSELGGQPRSNIGRLNAKGAVDEVFHPSADNQVTCLAIQNDGKILVGGKFTTLDGPRRSRIGRLNPDGSLDMSFNPGADDEVSSLVLCADGRILVGGRFMNLGGQPRKFMGRLNADGTLDDSFNPAPDGPVCSLMPFSDGKVLVGGSFSALGGQPCKSLGRLNLDGTLDNGFSTGADRWVRSLAVQLDGKILVGGEFRTLGGSSGSGPRTRIGRLSADGSLDASFSPGADVSFDPSVEAAVRSLAVQADGKILVGGNFKVLGGQRRGCIGRLH